MNVTHRPAQRMAVELRLDEALMADARKLGLDATGVMAAALRKSVAAETARRWCDDNAGAIAADDAPLDRGGLWCDEFRR